MSKPEEQYKKLLQNVDNTTLEDFTAAYDALNPVEPDFLLGDWKGGPINSPFNDAHASHKTLLAIKWAGKNFKSPEDVDPIMAYDAEGKRVFQEKWGHARLRKVEFRGVVSTAMIYDNFAIIDSFRYVDDNTVAGLMDARDQEPYHFYLERLPAKNGNL